MNLENYSKELDKVYKLYSMEFRTLTPPKKEEGDHMIKEVIQILNELGFEVQQTFYEHLIENDAMKYLKSINLPDSQSANIIRYFPDLFVMHREINPKDGTFFVVLRDGGKDIPDEAQKIYKKFFPHKIMVISGNPGNLLARWFHATGKPEPFASFIKREVGLGKPKK